MSVLQKALASQGIELQQDKLPADKRTQKVVAGLIADIRKFEADVNDQLAEAQRQLNVALRENLALRNENEQLRADLVRQKLQKRTEEIPSLSVADRQKLLGALPAEKNGE